MLKIQENYAIQKLQNSVFPLVLKIVLEKSSTYCRSFELALCIFGILTKPIQFANITTTYHHTRDIQRYSVFRVTYLIKIFCCVQSS